MASSPSNRRLVDPDLQPRAPQAGTLVTLLSLLFLGAVVAAVALFVLRTSPATFISATNVEPTGTTIAAPDIQAAPPTLVPTVAPLQSTTDPGGEPQAIAMLPTVAAPTPELAQVAAPTPTPRAVVLPTVIPMTLPSPTATRPPSQLVVIQPVAAFDGGDTQPETLAATTSQPAAVASEPARPVGSRSVAPTQVASSQDNLQRALAMQTNRVRRGSDRSNMSVNHTQTAMPADRTDEQTAPVPIVQYDPSGAAPNTSVSVPDANAIRDEVAARIKAPRP